jgi:membrane protease subunit (stomatin/prohibitin family)
MTKNTLGYVELEWTCPNCGNKNPGMQKSCGTCGAPQPENVQFDLGQKPDLIKDEEKKAEAAKGPDIHCPFCNTRNSADAQVCIQCGGDLKEGLRRESGRVLAGAPDAESNAPLTCPSCGTLNQPGASLCSACGASLVKTQIPALAQPAAPTTSKESAFRPWMMLPVAAILMLCCVVLGFFFFRTTALSGTVQNTQWQRVIAIQSQREITREAWRDQLPGDARVLSCQQAYRSRQDNPEAGAREVCSTELVDQGNGAARVVETCYYEVYDDYCKYQALEWQNVEQATANGSDLQPYWPKVNPASGQREGERTEIYTVYFETRDGIKQFTTSNAALYAQLQPGSEWTLSINSLGAVVDVAP